MINKILMGVIILGILVLSGCSTTGDAVKITNPIQTCKNVEVSYQDTEYYTENYKYEVVGSVSGTFLKGFDVYAEGNVQVRNVDSETGSFIVQQTFSTLDGAKTLSSTQYIMPGETKTFTEEYVERKSE